MQLLLAVACLICQIRELLAKAKSHSATRLRSRVTSYLQAGHEAFSNNKWYDAVQSLRKANDAAESLQAISLEDYKRPGEGSPSVADMHLMSLVHHAKAIIEIAGHDRTESRHTSRTEAKELFEKALSLSTFETLLRPYDFVLPYSTLLWTMHQHAEAESLFESSKKLHMHERRVFPWMRASQMPAQSRDGECNSDLFTQEPEAWFGRPNSFGVGRFLAKHAKAFKYAAQNFAGEGDFREYEGHAAEYNYKSSNQPPPWTELVLFDRKKKWATKGCAALPDICRAFRKQTLPEIEGRPSVKVKAFGYCCRVSVLRLLPGAQVLPHTGNTNQRLVAHLGLRVPEPESCGIRVDGIAKTWKEDEILLFDDSYVHEVWNNGTQERWVLYVAFIHPKLQPSASRTEM